EQKLPRSQEDGEECSARMVMHDDAGCGEADGGEKADSGFDGAGIAQASEQQKQDGEDEVELLFDAERPGVEERFEVVGRIEVSVPAPQQRVGAGEHGGEK